MFFLLFPFPWSYYVFKHCKYLIFFHLLEGLQSRQLKMDLCCESESVTDYMWLNNANVWYWKSLRFAFLTSILKHTLSATTIFCILEGNNQPSSHVLKHILWQNISRCCVFYLWAIMMSQAAGQFLIGLMATLWKVSFSPSTFSY